MINASFAASLIRRARKNRNHDLLTADEVSYVLGHPDLSGDEKLLWLDLACHTAGDPSLSCTFEIESFLHLFKGTENEVLSLMLSLRQKGFLEVALNVPLSYFVNGKSLLDMIDKVRSLGRVAPDHVKTGDLKSLHCTMMLPPRGLAMIVKSPFPDRVVPKIIERQRRERNKSWWKKLLIAYWQIVNRQWHYK
jgi:hypothetical protein